MGRRALILEAHHTTHIEGTRLTLKQAEQLLEGKPVPEADPEDARELLNYREAFDFVSEYLEEGGPITEGLIREIHRRLVEGVRGGGRTSRLLSTLWLCWAGYDFERLFTISEYYDRDRLSFCRAIQGVRDSGMDLTGWLEYFVQGLATQLVEVRQRSEQAIRRDGLVKQYGLSGRQTKAVEHIPEWGRLTIQDFELLSPDVNRRSLQRDLKAMVDEGLLSWKARPIS